MKNRRADCRGGGSAEHPRVQILGSGFPVRLEELPQVLETDSPYRKPSAPDTHPPPLSPGGAQRLVLLLRAAQGKAEDPGLPQKRAERKTRKEQHPAFGTHFLSTSLGHTGAGNRYQQCTGPGGTDCLVGM